VESGAAAGFAAEFWVGQVQAAAVAEEAIDPDQDHFGGGVHPLA
jgi:hypothetical protein